MSKNLDVRNCLLEKLFLVFWVVEGLSEICSICGGRQSVRVHLPLSWRVIWNPEDEINLEKCLNMSVMRREFQLLMQLCNLTDF